MPQRYTLVRIYNSCSILLGVIVFRLPSVRRNDDGNDIAAALLAELGISAKREEEPAGGGEVAATIESNWVE